jgi:hypothetical protein
MGCVELEAQARGGKWVDVRFNKALGSGVVSMARQGQAVRLNMPLKRSTTSSIAAQAEPPSCLLPLESDAVQCISPFPFANS